MTQVEIGKGLRLDVDTQRINAHEAVFGHIVYIGLKNILQDSHAGAKREDFDSDEAYKAASLAMAQKKLDAMYNGVLRANTSGPRASSVDPIQAEALREARVFVGKATRGWEKDSADAIAWLTKAGTAMGLPHATADDRKAIIAAAIARRAAKPEMIAAATKVIEARNSIVIDAEELGI